MVLSFTEEKSAASILHDEDDINATAGVPRLYSYSIYFLILCCSVRSCAFVIIANPFNLS